MDKNSNKPSHSNSPEVYVFNTLKYIGIYVPTLTVLSYLISLVKTYSYYCWFSFDVTPFLSVTDILLPNFFVIVMVGILITFLILNGKWFSNHNTSERHQRFVKNIPLLTKVLPVICLTILTVVLWISRNDTLKFKFFLGFLVISFAYFSAIFVSKFINNIIIKSEDNNSFYLFAINIVLLFVPCGIGWQNAYRAELKSGENKSTFIVNEKIITSSDSFFSIGVTSNYIFMFDTSDRSTSIYKLSEVSYLKVNQQ